MGENNFTITVRRRPRWAWLLAVLWLAAVVLLVQTAIGSGAEEEPRAAAISWAVAVALVVMGAVAWTRRGRDREPEGPDEP